MYLLSRYKQNINNCLNSTSEMQLKVATPLQTQKKNNEFTKLDQGGRGEKSDRNVN